MFTQKDQENLIELLNAVAKKAKFQDMEVADMIKFVKLLNWAQTDLLPKMDKAQFEVISTKGPEELQAKPKKATK